MKKGIDLSHHNPAFNFIEAKKKIDFVMIRAGFGKNNEDREFKRNVKECTALKIPFGLYWFSYALTPEMAEREADYVCDKALGLNLDYPIAFDFEYGSIEYMKKHGIKINAELIHKIAVSFLKRVEERGYYAMLYTNRDFLQKYFDGLEKRYSLWFAEWNVENPSAVCQMWQYGVDEELNVDGNYCYKDFPEIMRDINFMSKSQKQRVLDSIPNRRWNDYYRAAKTIMSGTAEYVNILEMCRNMNLDFTILNIVVEIAKGE